MMDYWKLWWYMIRMRHMRLIRQSFKLAKSRGRWFPTELDRIEVVKIFAQVVYQFQAEERRNGGDYEAALTTIEARQAAWHEILHAKSKKPPCL